MTGGDTWVKGPRLIMDENRWPELPTAAQTESTADMVKAELKLALVSINFKVWRINGGSASANGLFNRLGSFVTALEVS